MKHILTLTLGLLSSTAMAQDVDIELNIILDTSSSVSDHVLFNLRDSLFNQTNNIQVIKNIQQNYHQKSLLTLWEYGVDAVKVQESTISTSEELDRFRQAYLVADRAAKYMTNTGLALQSAITHTEFNSYNSILKNYIVITDGMMDDRSLYESTLKTLDEHSNVWICYYPHETFGMPEYVKEFFENSAIAGKGVGRDCSNPYWLHKTLVEAVTMEMM